MDQGLIFQIIDWHHADEKDIENEKLKYVIRIFGRTGSDQNYQSVYMKVLGFKPYFYVRHKNSAMYTKYDEIYSGLCGSVSGKTKYANTDRPTYNIIEKQIFKEFKNSKKDIFLKLVFDSHALFRKWRYYIEKNERSLELYESNIEPFIKFMHDHNIGSCGWVQIKKYEEMDYHESFDDINIEAHKQHVKPYVCNSMTKFIEASFDIECISADGGFPQAENEGDKIIGISTTLRRSGESHSYYKHMVTLRTCDQIEGVDVTACKTERELLRVWQRKIQDLNPDIITGYNIKGFDYRYIEGRARLKFIDSDDPTKGKNEAIYNKSFGKFSKLRNYTCKFTKKELSSAGLGENILYYYETPGRVQIDLMKVVQRDHKLPQYNLDFVAPNFIRGDAYKIVVENGKNFVITKVTAGLDVERYIKFIFKKGHVEYDYEHGKKYKILSIRKKKYGAPGKELDMIQIDGNFSKNALEDFVRCDKKGNKKFKFYWCLAKDDLDIKKMFKMFDGTATDRAIIAKYCVQDSVLCNKLMDKLNIIQNNIGMANVCLVPLSYIFLRGQGIKIYSLVSKACASRGFLIPQRKIEDKVAYANNPGTNGDDEYEGSSDEELDSEVTVEGATVLKPELGVHHDAIGVLDYTALYPSSMIEKNMSHETYVAKPEYDNLPGYTYYEQVAYFTDGSKKVCRFAKKDDEIGILPTILIDLLSKRKKINGDIDDEKKKAEVDDFKISVLDGLQLAYKVTANSLYGQTGARTSAIFKFEIAGSTTSRGREMLHCARLFIERILPKLVTPIIEGEYDLYYDRINLLFSDENDKCDIILGSEIVEELKTKQYNDKDDDNTLYLSKPHDYYYLKTFYDRIGINNAHIKANVGFIEYGGDKITTIKQFFDYVLDEVLIITENGRYSINPMCAYGDTDSTFNKFNFVDIETNQKLQNRSGLMKTILMSKLASNIINLLLPHPQNLKYEKTFWPWIILAKKKYVGNKYVNDNKDYYENSMGIVLKRRDNAPIVKIVVGGIVGKILNTENGDSTPAVINFVNKTLTKILCNKYDSNMYIITKTLKTTYKQADKQAHVVLARRMTQRDPGNAPQSNDRIPFVYIVIPKYKTVDGHIVDVNVSDMLQGDMVEHPSYVKEHNIQIDHLFYITNQVMKPSIQFLQHITSNSEEIFNRAITIEENMRLGIKPITYYLGNDNNNGISLEDETQTPVIQIRTKYKPRSVVKTKRKETNIRKGPIEDFDNF